MHTVMYFENSNNCISYLYNVRGILHERAAAHELLMREDKMGSSNISHYRLARELHANEAHNYKCT